MSQRTARDVLEMLKDRGYYALPNRTKGDHHRFTDGKGHKVTVPYSRLKDNIYDDTYNYILKQMGDK